MALTLVAQCLVAAAAPHVSPSPAGASMRGLSSSPMSSSFFSESTSLKIIPALKNGSSLRQLRTEDDDEAQHLSLGSDRNPILDPALKHANLMWFRGSYNAQIFVSEDEPADSVVRRFRKAVMQAGVIPECRRRRFFETPQDIVKRKVQAAQRRNKTRRFTPRPDISLGDKKEGGPLPKASVDDDDYWGYLDDST